MKGHVVSKACSLHIGERGLSPEGPKPHTMKGNVVLEACSLQNGGWGLIYQGLIQ